jgi:uncharacterized membrane protein YraQ (UPF0718 family)
MKKNKILTFSLLTYVVLYFTMPEISSRAISQSTYYIKEMFMIMPIVLIISALIETWVPRETIIKTFGKKSGLKGPIFSFLLGSLSAGPIYAAFPVCTTLYKKGAKVSNIVIILSSWAVIKVPMLINEYRFLGGDFMLYRWIFTVVAIIALAFIMEKVIIKGELPVKQDISKENEKTLKVDCNLCVDCSLCAKECPSYFHMEDGCAKVKKDILNLEEVNLVSKAIKKCPVNAISAD